VSHVDATGQAASGRAESAATRWELIESLLHEALTRDAVAREGYLRTACPDDACRREVEALIRAHERSGKLDELAAAVMRPLLSKADEAPPRLTILPTLARYQIVDRLGGGGMGVVYRARDERLERQVALKFLPPHLSSDEAAKKRFMVEARAAASLEHPNICTVHEIGETDDGQLYIVMGCYDGETLDRRIARGALPLDEALRIVTDVARGLAKAHDRGIVHRDVKPANIMITADGVVKILDFGIAKLGDAGLTQTGVVGTISYMSPEQAFGEAVDHRADIWALGVMLYEMLAGVRPFRGPGDQALLFSILTQEPEPLTDIRSDVPPELATVIRRALAKRAQDRFATTHELLAALGAVAVVRSDRVTGAAAVPVRAKAADSPLTGAGERRQATIVVTSIADYADLVERLPSDALERITTGARDAATEAATRHGGIVNHFAGDEAVMLFGVATAHEDDSLRAVRATLALHAGIRRLGDAASQASGVTIRMRSGVHTGPVVAQRQRSGDKRFRVTGAPLDVAARLAGLAEADAILVSAECHRLVAPFIDAAAGEEVVLQHDVGPVTPYRVVGESSIQTRLEFAERVGLTPYAGRSRELNQLEEKLAAIARDGGSIAVVIGEAGSGKSRLLYELRRRVDASLSRLVMGRCDAYGGTTPYLPFVQVIRDLLELDDPTEPSRIHADVVERVRAIDPSLAEFLPLYLTLLSVPSDEFPLPTHLQGKHLQTAMLEAITALLTVHARLRPTVVLLEDWHWADDGSRAALEQLTEIAPTHPLLVVVSCRPDSEMSWTAQEHRMLVHLGPLGPDASLEIMRAVLGAERISPELATQLHDRTGGNPFFLEETCQALREEEAVVVRGGKAVAVAASGTVQLPETVQAVIRTRLDRLDVEARDALRIASVIGREFARGVLDDIAGRVPQDLSRPLERLRGAGLIQQTSVVPEPLYRFKHVLTQEVAYDTLLEHQRKALHGAAGHAMERRYAERLDEHLERLAHHFSRAEEWRDAIRYGIRSADRASAFSQLADALSTLDRVQQWITCLSADPEREALIVDVLLRQERLCETLGLRQRQLRIAEELIDRLAPLGASLKLAEAYLRQGDVCTLLRRFDAADRALATALRISREQADRASERNVLRSIGLLRSHEGRPQDAIASFGEALVIDRELGEAAAGAADLASLGNVFRNVGRHEEAKQALEHALEVLTGESNWAKRSAVKVVIGAVHRELGDVERALRYLEDAASEAIERRNPIQSSFALSQLAHVHLQQGRIEESLRTYWRAVDLTRRGGHTEGLVQSLRAIGEVLVGLGRFAEALPALREAAVLFDQLEDREAEALVWGRIATASERCGDRVEARDAWERARALCLRLGDLCGEGRALEGIARVDRQLGGAAAIPRYEEVLHHAVNVGDRAQQLTVHNSLGILHWESGRYAEALAHYEAALRLCRALDDRIHEGLVLNSLGATLLRLQRVDEARTTLDEAVRVNATSGQRQLEGHALATLGEACLAAGRIDDARRHIEASLSIRRELGDRRGEGWMLERIARILDASGLTGDAASSRAAAGQVAREVGDATLATALEQDGRTNVANLHHG
jgi:tetratricopeptide (TPR) repeat protein/class 3 adenylate cyclase